MYQADLLALANMIAPTHGPSMLRVFKTPMILQEWDKHLREHPDQIFARYLVDGIQHGFRIGFKYRAFQCGKAKRNMVSAIQNPEVVQEYLEKECKLGRVWGPLSGELKDIHINRFGVIPKANQPGKWRLIVDLSHPEKGSINAGLDPTVCSLEYASVDDAVDIIWQMGRGTVLAKVDLESAYRMVPIHPDDRPLLGMEWGGQIYVDTALPFGLRSAPKIFNALADGLQWIMGQKGIQSSLHYLDDFLFFGKPKSPEGSVALQTALRVCGQLGVPVAHHKVEGPAVQLVFLGIELDTEKMELRLPQEKLKRLQRLLFSWHQKRVCTKRELLSLIGHLQHACRVVPAGRSFLRRMIDLSMVVSELHHHVRLNLGFRSDLQWWLMFVADWNGVRMMSRKCKARPHEVVTSDASGSWGCGAFSSANCWFQLTWPVSWSSVHITVKELLPIVVACAVWEKEWAKLTVMFRCDNAAVVAIINSGRSKDKLVMHLMRCLSFFGARYNFFYFAVHVPGKDNVAADSLSRNNLSLFYRQVPKAKRLPTQISEDLRRVLTLERPDWTSSTWRALFSSILRKV